jgi:hypothetical protein
MYVYSNIETRSCNHWYRGKAKISTYSECVFVALGVRHDNAHASYCHLKSVRLYNIFPHYLREEMIFGVKSIDKFSLQILSETFLTLRRISKILS